MSSCIVPVFYTKQLAAIDKNASLAHKIQIHMIFSAEFLRFVTFGLIGVFNTLFDLAIWKSVVFLTQKNPAFIQTLQTKKLNEYSFAQAIAFILANIFSYFLNRFITFKDSVITDTTGSLLKFIFVSLIAFTVSVVSMNILTKNTAVTEKFVSKLPQLLQKHWPILAKLCVVVITLLINYFGYKLLVFKV
jgi:putative flippase GtrA